MLFSFGSAIALLALAVWQPFAGLALVFEVPIFLLLGIAVGYGFKILGDKDGYLVRGDEPEEEVDR